MKIFSLLIFLLFVAPLSAAEAGHKHDPHESKIYKDQTHSKHWSGKKPTKPYEHRKSIKHKRHYFLYTNGYYLSPYVRYKKVRPAPVYIEKKVEPRIIRERTVIKKRYVPVQKRFAPLTCGGDTVYSRDKTTGELIIQYVSPAKKC